MNGTSSTPSSTSSSFYTEFSPVHRKKRKSRAPKEREPLLAIVQRLREELGHDDWLSECQQILVESLAKASLATISEVICLGLGSPAASATARVQLAFLLAICENLNIDRAKVFLYDPVFTAEDMTLFAELQVQLLTENKDAAYVIDHPTLCFMPHCDLALYENIIRANWSKTRLPNLVLVANRLADYVESNPRHQLETKAPFLLNLAPTLQCHPFPASRPWPTAFNNTALQHAGGEDVYEIMISTDEFNARGALRWRVKNDEMTDKHGGTAWMEMQIEG
ncbi:putative SRR1 [Lyophyllum shimeji]|uniref:SRR1 n=1 Tax=Lyophyllum shimeji TaxID=47721 RepID=A0A9P3UL95_LYOSH|nr:putative SRR1 [Lyophyllum shimeji]